jgi:sulfate adenylyltransferase subunit 1
MRQQERILKEKADIKIDGAEVLAGWESEVDATTADVAAYIKKNA